MLRAAAFLASSLRFCLDTSSELARLDGDCMRSIAASLRKLAEEDSAREAIFSKRVAARTAAWWLIGNVAMVTSMLLALSEAKSGSLLANFTPESVKEYFTSHCQLVLAAAMVVFPLLLANLAAWMLVHMMLCWAPLPALLIEPLPARLFHWLSLTLATLWFLIKAVMLAEVLVNHDFYRGVLAKRRKTIAPSFAYHLADAVYGFSYTILGFLFGFTALSLCAWLARSWAPSTWSPLGILLQLSLRGALTPWSMRIKATIYFCMHRMLHIQPFYSCWHKEHHFSASQTCLTASQESGLVEAAVEALYVQLAFVLVPFFDHSAYLWTSVFNSLSHHYYEDYKSAHWKVIKHMMLTQQTVRSVLAKIEMKFRAVPMLADNVQHPSEEFKSPHLGLGSIEKAWHGRHHWTTERRFGYGTYDCISNLGSDGSLDQDKREAQLEAFLTEYIGLKTGQIKTTSLVNR
ncbi:unnamed protein product [Effrenium voratum]|nr:unnamed protein product [Effrenium voratum]